MGSVCRFLVGACALILGILPGVAQAQVNAFSCTNCNVYDIQNLPPNTVILAFHYYCDNSTNERAEIFYAPVSGAGLSPLGYVTSDDKFIIKGRVSSSYAQFYNAASTNDQNNGVGTDPYASLSSTCRSKLQNAGLTNSNGIANHTLDLSFQYNKGMTVSARDSHGLATAFEIRNHADPTNSGTATGASVLVSAQEKFNMDTPPISFHFAAGSYGQGWLMGSANQATCPRLSGAASTSDWLFKPVFNRYQGQCNDGIDNDGDGKVDLVDPDCSGPTDPSEFPECSDGADNDGDGATDYPADFSCSGPTDNDETNPKAQCQDGIDNDGDGATDYPADPGCSSKQDNDEHNNVQCDDGIDNDGDGKIDYKVNGSGDPDCTDPTDNNETGTTQCSDNLDNDGDGFIDYPSDPGCSSRSDNDEHNNVQCDDGIDNDGDGKTDYKANGSGDPDCTGPTDPNETGDTQCSDNIDNDGDGAIDYPADPGCSSRSDNDEHNNVQCDDGIDNDGDGKIDYKANGTGDPGCIAPGDPDEHGSTQCDNAVDDDGDGKIDYKVNGSGDPDCTGPTDNNESGTSQCSDNADNDGDGLIDYPADPGCSSRSDDDEHNSSAQCDDGIDNDGDGKIDYKVNGTGDPGCSSPTDPDEHGTTQCDDGIDNDSDGKIDYKVNGSGDPDCTDPTDNNETGTTQCSDNVDNDGDGLIDYPADPGCFSRDDNDEHNPSVQCDDGIDNDGDGKIDYKANGTGDPGCTSPTDPDEHGPAQCDDGIDNDGDGKIDYKVNGSGDPGCTGPSDPDEHGTTQCDNAIDDDGDGKIDYKVNGSGDPGCTDPSDNSENTDSNVAPQPPQNVQATDGAFVRRIDVTWNAVNGATSYNVYRSESPDAYLDPNFSGIIASGVSGTYYSDQDPNLEPGVKYYYSVRAVNQFGTSGFATPDSGFALCSPGNCDCDGVSDAVEQQDGTDQCDGGDFQLHLKSPAFTKYNTFLTQENWLELVAAGTKNMNILVTVYAINGTVRGQQSVTIAAGSEFDVNIPAMVNQIDTYGVVKIEFDDQTPGSVLIGRLSNYRRDPTEACKSNQSTCTYSFAFTKELRNATTGPVYAGANSMDPVGQHFIVPNWTEIINLDASPQTFVYNLYNQDGAKILTERWTLPPLGEVDRQAGHEFGEGLYLSEVLPVNSSAPYFATVSRYSANSRSGAEAPTYNFAFSLEGRKGTGSPIFAPITNRTSSTWAQTNWVEVLNSRDSTVTAVVEFRDQNGNTVETGNAVLKPKSQFHFNAAGVLGIHGLTGGSVRVTSTTASSLVVQSLTYFHDAGSNSLQTAYMSQARVAGPSLQTGSLNSFLDMSNRLTLVNATTSGFSATVQATLFGSGALPAEQVNFAAGGVQALDFSPLSGSASTQVQANTYGVVKVSTPSTGLAFGEILRQRELFGKVDFAFPTAVQ